MNGDDDNLLLQSLTPPPGAAAPSAAVPVPVDPNDPLLQTLTAAPPKRAPGEEPLTFGRAAGLVGTGLASGVAQRLGGAAASEMAEEQGADPFNLTGARDPSLDPLATGGAVTQAAEAGLGRGFGRTVPNVNNPLERTLFQVGAALPDVGMAALGGGGLGPLLARTGGTLAGAIGTGAGAGIAEKYAPESRWAQFLLPAAGGFLGGFSPAAAIGAGRWAWGGTRPIVRPGSVAQERAAEVMSPGGGAPGGPGISYTMDPERAAVPPVSQADIESVGSVSPADIAAVGNPNLSTLTSATPRDPVAINTRAGQDLDLINGAAKNEVRAAWNSPEMLNETMPVLPIANNHNDFTSNLPAISQKRVGALGDYADVINEWGTRYPDGQVPLSEVQALRSDLLANARSATDGPTKTLLQRYERALFGGADEENEFAVSPDTMQISPDKGQAWNDAIAATKAYYDTYGKGTPLGRQLNNPRAYDSSTFDDLLGPGKGQTERVASFVQGTNPYEGQSVTSGDLTRAVNPQQDAREWFTQKLQAAAGQGSNRLESEVAKNQPLINSDLFTDEQRQAVDALRRQTVMGELVGAANSGSQQLDRAVGNIPSGLFSPDHMDVVDALRRQTYMRELQDAAGRGSAPLEAAVASSPVSGLLSPDRQAVVDALRRQTAMGEVTGAAAQGPGPLQSTLTGPRAALLSSPLFSPEQQQGIQLMGRAAAGEQNLAANPEEVLGLPRGAPRAAGLVAGSLLGTAAAATQPIGAALGVHVPGEMFADLIALQALGAGAGGHGGLGRALYQRAANRTQALLQAARQDPVAAARLASQPPPAPPGALSPAAATGTALGMLPF